MPPTIHPASIRHLDALTARPGNQLRDLTSRQGLEPGTEGPEGKPGKEGKEGKAATTFTFTQGAPAEVWTIKHELGRFPSVTVQDTAGDEVMGIVDFISENELTVTFSAAVSGTAYLN